MPIDAKLVVADPNVPLPIYEADVSLFALPDVGDHWWHETFAANATDVEEGDVPRIRIERDPDVTRELYHGLPQNAEIGANLDPASGVWEVHVVGRDGRILGLSQGRDATDDVFEVAGRARAEALN